MIEARRTPWHVWATGLVMIAFAAYCGWILVSVRTLRTRIENNVHTLGRLQAAEAAVGGAQPDWQRVDEELGQLRLPMPAVVEAAARARAGEAPATELVEAADEAIRAVRGDSSRVATTLWRRWTALYIIIGAALLLGVANLWLLVVAHRRRLLSEESERQLSEHHETLQRTATRLAGGDRETPVAPRAAEYDEFEQALEDMRRDLVEQINALRARNRQVEQLADDLREQIRERSSEMEQQVAQELTAKDQLVPGAVFAERYRVVKPIGSGATGDVYQVTRERDGETFALKLLRHVRSPRDKVLFAREARALAELRHDSIVNIHQVGTSPAGTPYLVLELVGGDNTHRLTARHGDVAWALPVLARVADAVAAIHAGGLVHRDIKPSNVMVSDGDPPVVKLIDFGIARAAPDETAEVDPLATPAPFDTQVGRLVGTPPYIAPELAEGAATAGPESDMFSFGVTAYGLLAGHLPFRVPPIDLAHTDELPPVRDLAEAAPAVPAKVATAVMQCLSFDPRERPDAAAMARVLAGALSLRAPAAAR